MKYIVQIAYTWKDEPIKEIAATGSAGRSFADLKRTQNKQTDISAMYGKGIYEIHLISLPL
jgi:hypothetical protein